MARSSRKGAAPGEDVRQRLLSGAAGLFSTKGYAATTVREIVERAGVTKPVLYYYFRNKEGIYLEMMRGPLERFASHLDAAAAEGGTARERIARLCLGAYEVFVEHLEHARVMFAIYYGPPQGAPFVDFDAVHIRFQDAVLRLLEEGIRRGEFRKGNARDMMWVVIGAVNVAMELELCRPGESIGSAGTARMLEIVLDGIAPATGEAKGKGKGK